MMKILYSKTVIKKPGTSSCLFSSFLFSESYGLQIFKCTHAVTSHGCFYYLIKVSRTPLIPLAKQSEWECTHIVNITCLPLSHNKPKCSL